MPTTPPTCLDGTAHDGFTPAILLLANHTMLWSPFPRRFFRRRTEPLLMQAIIIHNEKAYKAPFVLPSIFRLSILTSSCEIVPPNFPVSSPSPLHDLSFATTCLFLLYSILYPSLPNLVQKCFFRSILGF